MKEGNDDIENPIYKQPIESINDWRILFAWLQPIRSYRLYQPSALTHPGRNIPVVDAEKRH